MKSEVLRLESNLLFLGGWGGGGVIYCMQLEGNLLHAKSKCLILSQTYYFWEWGGGGIYYKHVEGNLLHEIRSA